MGNSVFNIQVGGDHYKGYVVEPIKVAMESQLDPCTFSIFKYILRYHDKNGCEDLKKALHYIDILNELQFHSNMDTYSFIKNCLLNGSLLTDFQKKAFLILAEFHKVDDNEYLKDLKLLIKEEMNDKYGSC